MRLRTLAPLAAATAATWLWAASLHAQSDVALELGASQIGPSLGVEGDHARFLVGGLRGSHFAASGSGIVGSVLLGQTLDGTTGGSFVSGIVEGTLVGHWTPSFAAGLDVRLMGFGVRNPYPYRAFAVEGGPELRFRDRNVSLTVSGVGGIGRSRLELFRVIDGPTRVFLDDLWRVGGTAELMLGPPTSSFGVVGGAHHTPAGSYRSVGSRLVLAGGWGLAELRLDRWDSPTGVETTGGLAFAIPLGSVWSLRGFAGRTEPDPLTLARPAGGSGGVLLGRSLVASATPSAEASGLYEIVHRDRAGSRVRISVEAADARAVDVLGDFTLWEPVPMTRDGDSWVTEIDVAPGTHHFGFLVDGEWHLPDDAPDVVPDEWGRTSATLVIEGVGR